MTSRIDNHSLCRSARRIAGLLLLISAASTLFAQEKPGANPAQPAGSSQPAKPDYRFEVASIRPTVQTRYEYGDPRLKPQFSPGLYQENAVTLASLVAEAFGIKHSYQMESPSWMGNVYFTVNAVPPKGATKADLPVMLRHLLEERFGLKYHRETRQMSGYELVMVKPAPGLTKSPAPASQRPTVKGPPIETDKDGNITLSKNAGSTELWTGTDAGMKVEWRVRNETMEQVAGRLADKVSKPVIDATGLEGEYDFTLLYSPELPSRTAGGDEASAPMEHSLLLDALREQLGLELRPVKNVPVDVIVIDSANKEPTEN